MSESKQLYDIRNHHQVRASYLRAMLRSADVTPDMAAFLLDIKFDLFATYFSGETPIPNCVIFACERIEHLASSKDPRRLIPPISEG